ncbi:hypothetical protein NDI37_21580, partial [Funiculus sociatus GB2-A5]
SAYSWRFSGARIACFFTSQTPDLLSSTIYTKLDELTLVVEDAQPGIVYPKFPYRSLELRLHIENQIHKGIKYILQSNFDWIVHHLPPEAYPGNVPSDWFG